MKFQILVAAGCTALIAGAQQRLTLADAEQLAVKNHPALLAGRLEAAAMRERVNQTRAARFPFVTGNLTAVGAESDSRIAAGGLNNPIIYSRFATGVSVSQTLLDFGRTSKLVESSRSAAEAGDQRAELTRAEVILGARRAYYSALRAENVLRVANATLDARQIIVDLVTELVRSQLKSSLDQSFAETNLAEARLLVSSAENERKAAYAELAQAVGVQFDQPVELAEEPQPNLEPLALSELTAKALAARPDLKAGRLEMESARQFASAEHALRLPSISAAMGAGYVPNAGPMLSSDYAAAGVNIALPFLNGGLYKAREAEAQLRAQAIGRRITDLENRVVRDVTKAWLDTNTASERIALTRQFVDQATQALELAQTRYELGLSSIVELSQAQLVKTNADIQHATAKYDYLLQRAILDYAAGVL